MPGDPVRLGPFAGGMNTLSDAAALDDSELLDIVNFELDLDGSLLSRAPITSQAGPAGAVAGMTLLTYGFFAATPYLIGSNSQGIWYYLSGVWTQITNTIQAQTAAQWRDRIWIPAKPGSANPGGWWSPSGGWNVVAAMPQSVSILSHKERLYSIGDPNNTSQCKFSDPQDGTTWGVNSFFNVSVGDGEVCVDLIVYNDAIVIFKNNSTYAMSFDSQPTQGTVRRISGTIGVSGKYCCIIYEQNLYVLHEANVYEVVNTDFSRINVKVPFTYDPTAPSSFAYPVSISLFGDRLIVRYYGRIYAFGFRTRTWTRWVSNFFIGPLFHQPSPPSITTLETYYAGSALASDTLMYRIKDGLEIGTSEAISLYIKSKIYDLAISARYKRLFWWGADVNTTNPVTGKVTPITYVFTPTWNQLAPYQWSQLQTWNQPISTAPTSTTTVSTGAGGVRRFLKFLKSIRFRQVQFEMNMTTDGTPSTAPARLFNMTAFIATRETVSKQIS